MFNKISDYFRLKKQDKEEFTLLLSKISNEIPVAEQEFFALFANKNEYIDVRKANDWKNKFSKTHDDASSFLEGGMIEKKKLPRKYEPVFKRIVILYNAIDKKVKEHNKNLLMPEKDNAVQSFSKVCRDAAPTEYQISAILSKDKRILITGAPSTGKTSALMAKYEYLNSKGNKVLLFNAQKTEEISDFALNLLSKNNFPIEFSRLSDMQTKEIILNFFKEKQSDASYRGRLIDYYFNFHTQGKTIKDFQNEEEYEKYISLCPPVTLKGEVVKSYEELAIADFLFSLGIEYSYKAPFINDVMLNGTRLRYRPSFTLPDHGVCINVFFNADESVEEIQNIHKEAEIPLIECYTEEKIAGNMLSKLQKVLSAYNIEFNVKSDAEILDAVQKTDKNFFPLLAESILLNLKTILATGESESTILTVSRTKSKTTLPLYRRRERLISLTLPFCNYYISNVKWDDFSILRFAANKIPTFDINFEYSHIFVDNAENLNAASALFLRVLAEKTDCKVVFAGCDWLSPICLNGTDPMYLRDFGRFFPGYDEIVCDKVFNLPAGIYDSMVKFALNNNGNYYHKPSYIKKAIGSIEKTFQSLSEISENLQENIKKGESAIIVCRYDFELEEIKRHTDIPCITVFDISGKYDIVIWYNSKYNNFGYPDEKLCLNNISSLILNRPDSDVFIGERNLLCKAITSTKGRFILLCDPSNVSDYINEISY